jgi:hypothetical protein
MSRLDKAAAHDRIASRRGFLPPHQQRRCPECGMTVGFHRNPLDYCVVLNTRGRCTQGEPITDPDGTRARLVSVPGGQPLESTPQTVHARCRTSSVDEEKKVIFYRTGDPSAEG